MRSFSGQTRKNLPPLFCLEVGAEEATLVLMTLEPRKIGRYIVNAMKLNMFILEPLEDNSNIKPNILKKSPSTM
eukprot:XP_001706819.1 Hypothetical protein GL50803_39547 [Giardia lamblia ATCC 50803]